MLEHLNKKQLQDYLSQQLGVAELLTVSEHLDNCEACRQQVQAEMNGDLPFLSMHAELADEHAGSNGHLNEAQTADYVDKNLSAEEQQFATDHLSACELCQLAVADLRAFRNEIAPSIDNDYQPIITQPTKPARSRWRQLSGIFPKLTSPAPAFFAALMVILFGTAAWLVWRATRPASYVATSPTSVPQPSINTESPAPVATPTPEEAVPVVAQLNDGNGQVALDQEGKLSGVENLPVNYQSMLKKALSSGRIDKSSQLNGLSRPPSSLMGSGNQKAEFVVLEPAGNVVMSDRPTFRWTPMNGATSYIVEIYDEQFQQVATSLNITTNSWTAPQAFSRGKVYSWQVKASHDGEEVTTPRPPAPQAKFRVLDQAKTSELARAQRAYSSSHLTMGLLYADAGLLKEAEQELRLVQKANPDSDLARNLLRQVQSLRR
ncbi:MAG TPA: zf-HC2 domain-containing protein [Pyrinomonadaceae bacterium]|nr:zf-HC2 domain-containing protein [Pyrinomonadaceae bacterium]